MFYFLEQERDTGHFHWTLFFLQLKQFSGKYVLPVTSIFCAMKNDYSRSSFVNNITKF